MSNIVAKKIYTITIWVELIKVLEERFEEQCFIICVSGPGGEGVGFSGFFDHLISNLGNRFCFLIDSESL